MTFSNRRVRVFSHKAFTSVGGAPGSAYDPATADQTGWWRASFSASPWVGTASAGTSLGRDLAEATNPPAAGAALNGLTPADFDGTNDLLVGATMATFFNDNSWAGSVLVFPDVAGTADAVTPYTEPGVFGASSFANGGLGFSTDGMRIWRLNAAAAGYENAVVACPTGSWSLIQWKGDGATIQIRRNGGAWVSSACVNPFAFIGNLNVGKGHDTLGAHLNGKIADLLLTDRVPGDTEFNNIKLYANARYGLAL